jgi:hypothetical protein
MIELSLFIQFYSFTRSVLPNDFGFSVQQSNPIADTQSSWRLVFGVRRYGSEFGGSGCYGGFDQNGTAFASH